MYTVDALRCAFEPRRNGLTVKGRATLILMVASTLGMLAGGCANQRLLPAMMMPTPPKECEQVLQMQVEPLPRGKTTDSQLAVWMAKESGIRQQEHSTSKVCAEYALRSAGTLKEAETPTEAQKGVQGARTSTVKSRRVSEPEPIVSSGGG